MIAAKADSKGLHPMNDPITPQSSVQDVLPSTGLTSDEARRRLEKFGPNAVPDTALHPLRRALTKFWAPVPWMLEAAIVLELFLGKYVEAAIIAALLAFNAILGFFQEGRAQATVAALKARLALNASVRRDNVWATLPATGLVPGDIVKLSVGAVVAADVRLTEGAILLDQSMLTGESIPIEAGPGLETYAGALVRRGETVAEVTATGARTKFGRTAELVRTAHVESSQQKAVLRVVRNLAMFNGVVIVILLGYAYALKMPGSEIIPLVLTAVLASIPVALPATFTLAAALGARALAHLGVLPTRLSAVDEAASIEVLCADKTGTLTRNELKVTAVHPMPGFDESHVLGIAALASSDGGQDPVDAAIRSAALQAVASDLPKLSKFVPFDSATKMSEATAVDPSGATVRALKGAFAAVLSLTEASPDASTIANQLEAQGFRVLAVAVGPPEAVKLAGIIALSDPPRTDSAALIKELRALGVRTVMVTGDAPATAAIVARAVGLDGAVCPPGPIPDSVHPGDFAVFAGVLPEGKYDLVKAFQKNGHTVGMCGDGANDAPALRQAQMGIAVSTATDVAKSAAGIVLTKPGLGGIVASVKEGRVTFQRILTYALNSLTKKTVQVLFLAVGLVMTGHAILTPMLMVIIMLTGDLLGMSMTTDNVRPSPMPNAWRIGELTIAGVFMGISELVFCTAILAIAKFRLGLGIETLRTLAFVVIVFGNQATTYTNRERRRLWSSRPSRWLIGSSVIDLLIASTLATCGIAMTPLPVFVVGGILVAAGIFAFILDFAKVPVFKRLRIAYRRDARSGGTENCHGAKSRAETILRSSFRKLWLKWPGPSGHE
jgi:H+-transporting ATPase